MGGLYDLNDLLKLLTLAPFRRYCRFLVLLTPPLFHLNFGGVLVAPDRLRSGQCEQVP